MGQLRLQLQISLIVSITVHSEICSLHPQHCSDLRRYTLLPREPLAEHYGLTREEYRRPIRIDRFIDAVHAVAFPIDCVADDSATNGLVAGVLGHPRPAKSRIGLPARFFIGQ